MIKRHRTVRIQAGFTDRADKRGLRQLPIRFEVLHRAFSRRHVLSVDLLASLQRKLRALDALTSPRCRVHVQHAEHVVWIISRTQVEALNGGIPHFALFGGYAVQHQSHAGLHNRVDAFHQAFVRQKPRDQPQLVGRLLRFHSAIEVHVPWTEHVPEVSRGLILQRPGLVRRTVSTFIAFPLPLLRTKLLHLFKHSTLELTTKGLSGSSARCAGRPAVPPAVQTPCGCRSRACLTTAVACLGARSWSY